MMKLMTRQNRITPNPLAAVMMPSRKYRKRRSSGDSRNFSTRGSTSSTTSLRSSAVSRSLILAAMACAISLRSVMAEQVISMGLGHLAVAEDFRVPLKKSLRHHRDVAMLRISFIIHPPHLLLRDSSRQPLADHPQFRMLLKHLRAHNRHGMIRRKV